MRIRKKELQRAKKRKDEIFKLRTRTELAKAGLKKK